MNLNTMYNAVNRRTYFSLLPDDIWLAINQGIDKVYQAIIAEKSGFFIETDTSTITITPNQLVYVCPSDLEQVLRIRERIDAQDEWRIIRHQDLTSYAMMQDSASAYSCSYDGMESQFTFYGPYLPASVADDSSDTETYSISIAPLPVDTREVEIVYVQKFVEVATVSDSLIIPRNGHGAVLDFAVGEALAILGDDRAEINFEKAQGKLETFLIDVRDRQLQDQRQVEPYLDDLS